MDTEAKASKIQVTISPLLVGVDVVAALCGVGRTWRDGRRPGFPRGHNGSNYRRRRIKDGTHE